MEIVDSNPTIEMLPKAHATFVHGETLTVASWHIEAGGKIPEHRHEHEQIINCLEGLFHVFIEGKQYILVNGKSIVIPSSALHSAVAITDVKCIDVFHPVREDYRL
ncbi:cupin domain-containing protein [Methylophaga sp.]|uniref:cupin domain-containing protein n=1 Tax=Methylophaga sp. TaxID=2024840 RepID=UPI003A9185DF